MRAFRTLLIASVGLLAAAACTVTVSDGEDDESFSDDDLGFDDQSPFDSDGFDDTDTTDTGATDTDPMDTDMTDTDIDTPDAGMATDDMTTDDMTTDDMTTDDMTTDDMTTDDMGDGGMMTDDMDDGGEACTAMPADECDQCMADDCATEYTLCFCDEECSAAFDMMHACYIDLGYDESNQPASEAEYADCQAMAGTPGTLLNNLVSCVERPLAEDDGERFAGDGTCTMACYGMFTVDLAPFVESD